MIQPPATSVRSPHIESGGLDWAMIADMVAELHRCVAILGDDFPALPWVSP